MQDQSAILNQFFDILLFVSFILFSDKANLTKAAQTCRWSSDDSILRIGTCIRRSNYNHFKNYAREDWTFSSLLLFHFHSFDVGIHDRWSVVVQPSGALVRYKLRFVRLFFVFAVIHRNSAFLFLFLFFLFILLLLLDSFASFT